MSKAMPVFIEDEKAIESFEQQNFSKELLKKVEEYLTIKLGINIKFYESTVWPQALDLCTDNLDNRDIGVFSHIIEKYIFRMNVYKSNEEDNKCVMSFSFNYEHHSGGYNGNSLNFYLIGDNKINTLREEKR